MKFKLIIFSCLLLLLSSCSRYYNWFTNTFSNDGIIRKIPICGSDYICSKTVYDQYRTVAFIDALWLNTVVRKSYVELARIRRNLSNEDLQCYNHLEIEKLNSEIAFYVLIPPSKQDCFSTDYQNTAPWAISLSIDGVSYQPVCIKALDLEPEYAYFFNCFSLNDNNFFRYRQAYFVKFNSKTCDNIEIINEKTCHIQLNIATVNYCTSCNWQLSADKREILW